MEGSYTFCRATCPSDTVGVNTREIIQTVVGSNEKLVIVITETIHAIAGGQTFLTSVTTTRKSKRK